MRTKGAKDKHKRKAAPQNGAEYLRGLAAARRLEEPSETVRVFSSVKAAMFAKVRRQDRTRFASSAIKSALDSLA